MNADTGEIALHKELVELNSASNRFDEDDNLNDSEPSMLTRTSEI